MKSATGYSKQQIWLHWAVVGLVALQIVLHNGMARAWDAAMETSLFALSGPVVVHFAIGGLILGLMMWRFALRQERGVPPPPDSEPPLLQKLGHTAHLSFYAILILLPVTGGLAWGTQSAGLGKAHEVLRALLVLLILGHIGAVIYHQRVLKSDLLRRMLKPDQG
ncbi:MAG: cytochrome b/b6 domain-containing protein [Dinoroseobacter sp.]|nr:cytochrome b/b6 domain-containing protein [Dinoroseobacter sp.]